MASKTVSPTIKNSSVKIPNATKAAAPIVNKKMLKAKASANSTNGKYKPPGFTDSSMGINMSNL